MIISHLSYLHDFLSNFTGKIEGVRAHPQVPTTLFIHAFSVFGIGTLSRLPAHASPSSSLRCLLLFPIREQHTRNFLAFSLQYQNPLLYWIIFIYKHAILPPVLKTRFWVCFPLHHLLHILAPFMIKLLKSVVLVYALIFLLSTCSAKLDPFRFSLPLHWNSSCQGYFLSSTLEGPKTQYSGLFSSYSHSMWYPSHGFKYQSYANDFQIYLSSLTYLLINILLDY